MKVEKDVLLMKLVLLRPTSDEIRGIFLFINLCDTKTVREVFEYVYKKSSVHHRLYLFFLINEVFNSKNIKLITFFKHFAYERLLELKKDSIFGRNFSKIENSWRKILYKEEILYKISNLYEDKDKFVEYLEYLIKNYKKF